MRTLVLCMAVAAVVLLGGCDEKKADGPPTPRDLTAEAIGHYCGMQLTEHPGPKAQIILASRADPIWFSSARDAFAFAALPEEPKDIRAIYVSDMTKAPSWADPGRSNWIEARSAVFVIGSRVKGGMGADEAIPFSDRSAAERFAAENGGRLAAFAEVPRDYILGPGGDAAAAAGAEGATPAPRHQH